MERVETRSFTARTRRWTQTPVLVLAAAVLLPALAHADEITVKGTVLSGTLQKMTPAGVSFTTEYGEGAIVVPYAEIEGLVTEEKHYVFYGDEEEAFGRILGIEEGAILVGPAPESATRVPAAGIVLSQSETEHEQAPSEALRSRFRYWKANVDVGLALKQSTTDTATFTVGFRTERKKKPTRLVLQMSYLLDTEKSDGSPKSTLDNELRGSAKGEYDLSERWFALASIDGEYDEVDRISIRTIPAIGAGYRVYETETARFQLEAAPSYVYERFFGGDTNDYPALLFAAETEFDLPLGSHFLGRAEYLPSLTDWTSDYILRADASFVMPITGLLAFKASLIDQYDSTPDDAADHNELKLMFGLSFLF